MSVDVARAEARCVSAFRASAASAIGWLALSCASAPLEPLPTYPAPFRPLPVVAARPPAATAPSARPSLPPAVVELPTASLPGSLPAVSLGDIGLPGPVDVLGSSSRGAWVALCGGEPRQARLVLGSGPGEPIDDVLAEDPSGRYLVISSGGSAELVDATKGSRLSLTELGADVRRLRADFAAHRTLSFDPTGKYLAYLRRASGPAQIVVRALETGTERTFPVGSGELLRLELSADARHVSFEVIREDTNHNGRWDWPAPEEPPRKSSCDKQPLRFRSFAYQGRGDALVRGVVTLAEGAVRDVPELVTPLGADLLLRSTEGSLLLERAGKRTLIAPAACAGRVLFADAERGLVLATCAAPPPKRGKGRPPPVPTGKREVWLFGAGVAINLQRELYETSTDRAAVVGARLVPLYPGSEASLLDLERRELLPLPPGSRVLSTSGALALVWRANELYRYDAQSKREEQLARGVAKNPELLRAGATVLLSPFVVVAAQGPALALASPERPLALTEDGFVLTGSSGGAADAVQAPLHWVEANARLPAPDGPPR